MPRVILQTMCVKYDALCYGAISLDISGRVAGLAPGIQDSATDYEIYPGGDATLVALTLAGLGWKVALAGGPVGKDPMGDYLRQRIAEAGIDLYADTRGKTSVSAVTVDRRGDRTSITFHEDTPLNEIPVPVDLVSRSRSLYACGCYGENSARLGEKARAVKVPSVLNARADNLSFLGWFDVAIASIANVRTLAKDPAEAAAILHAAGAGTAIVTAGEQGCAYCTTDTGILSAYKVDPVDCTGAGAAFAAGFIHAGLQGLKLQDRLRYASAAGALKCLHRGSYRRLTQEELDHLVESWQVNTNQTVA
ncbi:putative ATP-dependent phosphofructokinase (PFK-B family) [Methanocella arvoryzae MRE50]|uniref:ATP-dependent phosphofructokinase (PFK-B family) n=2 Tax=Methanocella TaxID=570266 RepID=Q0W2N9_METAR|nr:putative ATP-dependent phosphofructokinase (PFK-B family) [Methanocella arvoryzae MRE50]